jgi:hypothetical protein
MGPFKDVHDKKGEMLRAFLVTGVIAYLQNWCHRRAAKDAEKCFIRIFERKILINNLLGFPLFLPEGRSP